MTVIFLVNEGVICCCLQATVADLQEAIHKRSKWFSGFYVTRVFVRFVGWILSSSGSYSLFTEY